MTNVVPLHNNVVTFPIEDRIEAEIHRRKREGPRPDRLAVVLVHPDVSLDRFVELCQIVGDFRIKIPGIGAGNRP